MPASSRRNERPQPSIMASGGEALAVVDDVGGQVVEAQTDDPLGQLSGNLHGPSFRAARAAGVGRGARRILWPAGGAVL